MAKADRPTVEQRLDVQELFARYCWALNTGDEQGYYDCFTEDGWVDHKPQGRCQGREAMQKLLHQIWYGFPFSYLGRQHLPNNFVMRREGNGVRVKAYWTINRLEQSMNQFHLFILGDWNAFCVEDDEGEWRFKELTANHWFRETAPWVGDPKVRGERQLPWG